MQRSFLALTKKATSIITMASMLSSVLNLGLMLPVKAQGYIEAADWIGGDNYYRLYSYSWYQLVENGPAPVQSTGTLASLTSYINSPFPATNDNEGTNVSYEFGLQSQIDVDPSGAYIKIATNNSNNTINDGTRENWNESWVADNDPETIAPNEPAYLNPPPDILHNLPSNIYISKVAIRNGNEASGPNTLWIKLECDMNNAPCTLDTDDYNYVIDLKNNPLLKPSVAGPHRQLFIVGSVSDSEGLRTESGVGKMTINSYYQGLTVQASVDARLTFAVSAYDISQAQPPEGVEYKQSDSNGCNFGTITPNIKYLCAWQLDASTNAVGGLQVYVVQDQNMTYPGSGAEIEQFEDGTLVESAAPAPWSEPTGQSAGGANAHLAYTSNDEDVFPQGSPGFAAGITTMTGAGAAANAGYGSLVADAYEPGDHQWLYGNILMSTVELEQAPASLGQSYGHTQYFIVVGNF